MERDPLVTIRTRPVETPGIFGASPFSLAGWAVAAEFLARMRDLNVISAQEVTAILDGALSELDESDLEQLAGQLDRLMVDWRSKAARCTGFVSPD
jgi:hypothetical protein